MGWEIKNSMSVSEFLIPSVRCRTVPGAVRDRRRRSERKHRENSGRSFPVFRSRALRAGLRPHRSRSRSDAFPLSLWKGGQGDRSLKIA